MKKTKTRTAEMNDRKRAAGLRRIEIWISNVKDTKFEREFDKTLSKYKKKIDALTEEYQAKKLESDNDNKSL